MNLVFDIETSMIDPEDPRYDRKNFTMNVASLACICAVDIDTDTQYTFHDSDSLERSGDLQQGLQFLLDSDILIGHNIKGFDIPAIQKLYPELKDKFNEAGAFDTLNAARQLFTWKELGDYDRKHNVQHCTYNAKALNSLGAWGDRLRDRLGLDLAKDEEFKSDANWTNLEINEELISYCMQDVIVNVKIYEIMIKTYKRRQKEAKDG